MIRSPNTGPRARRRIRPRVPAPSSAAIDGGQSGSAIGNPTNHMTALRTFCSTPASAARGAKQKDAIAAETHDRSAHTSLPQSFIFASDPGRRGSGRTSPARPAVPILLRDGPFRIAPSLSSGPVHFPSGHPTKPKPQRRVKGLNPNPVWVTRPRRQSAALCAAQFTAGSDRDMRHVWLREEMRRDMGKATGRSGGSDPRPRWFISAATTFAQHGFVNTPFYRGSTVLYPTLASLEPRASHTPTAGEARRPCAPSKAP